MSRFQAGFVFAIQHDLGGGEESQEAIDSLAGVFGAAAAVGDLFPLAAGADFALGAVLKVGAVGDDAADAADGLRLDVDAVGLRPLFGRLLSQRVVLRGEVCAALRTHDAANPDLQGLGCHVDYYAGGSRIVAIAPLYNTPGDWM